MDNDMDDKGVDTLIVAAEVDVEVHADHVGFVIASCDPGDEYRGKWQRLRTTFN